MSQNTCQGCLLGLGNQQGHMDFGGCLYQSSQESQQIHETPKQENNPALWRVSELINIDQVENLQQLKRLLKEFMKNTIHQHVYDTQTDLCVFCYHDKKDIQRKREKCDHFWEEDFSIDDTIGEICKFCGETRWVSCIE